MNSDKIIKKIVLIISVIVVIAIPAFYSKSAQEIDCKISDTTQRLQCWDSAMESALKADNIEAGFDLIEKWYAAEPSFRSECHAFTHKLGESGYRQYSIKGGIDLTSKASYCGYGFYHGFMETMLASTGSLKEAHEFCLSAGNKFMGEIKKPTIACFHGIGHGAVDGSDPRAWGNEEAIIAPAIHLCEEVGQNEWEKNLCATGIYNALSIAYSNRSYGLEGNSIDPYDSCKKLSKKYLMDACYEEMNTNAMRLAGNDFSRAIKFAEGIDEDRLAIIAVENMSPIAAQNAITTKQYEKDIIVCQSTQGRLRLACVAGMVGGILEKGTPGVEYLDGIEFCGNDALKEEFVDGCFDALIGHSSVLYPPSRVIGEICDKIPTEHRENCPK